MDINWLLKQQYYQKYKKCIKDFKKYKDFDSPMIFTIVYA